mgnify:CR=1 FL=1
MVVTLEPLVGITFVSASLASRLQDTDMRSLPRTYYGKHLFDWLCNHPTYIREGNRRSVLVSNVDEHTLNGPLQKSRQSLTGCRRTAGMRITRR